MENDSARNQVAEEEATFRTAFVILAALVIVFLDRFVHYGSQGGQILMYGVSEYQGGLGLTRREALTRYESFQWLLTWALLAGGVLALAVGPRIALILGTLAFSASFLATAPTDGPSLDVSEILRGLGHGCIAPSVYVIAAQQLSIQRRAPRLSLFFALYACVNLGAYLGTSIVETLGKRLSFATARREAGILLIVAVALAVGIALLERHRRRPKWTGGRRLTGLFILLPFVAWFWFALSWILRWSAQYSRTFEPQYSRAAGPVLLVLASAAAILMLTSWRQTWPVPPTAHCIVFGLGLASAGYFAIDVITTGAEPNLRLFLPILLLLTLPELLLVPGLATAATGFGDRFGVLVMALFLAVEGTLVTEIPRRLDDPSVISVGSVAAVTLGMAVLLWFLRARVTSLLSAP